MHPALRHQIFNRITLSIIASICFCLSSSSCTPPMPDELTPKMVVGMWMMYGSTNQWEKANQYCTQNFLENEAAVLKIFFKYEDAEFVDADEAPQNPDELAIMLDIIENDEGFKCTIDGDIAKVWDDEGRGEKYILKQLPDGWKIDSMEGLGIDIDEIKKLEREGRLK